MTAIPQLGEEGRTCAACRYFDPRGLCRFNAPSVVGWPATSAVDWCGEWGPPRTEMQPAEESKIRAALTRDAGRADPMHPPMQERQGRLGGVR